MVSTQRIMRLPEVLKTVGLSRSTLYKQISIGLFPAQISLGARAKGWLSQEVEALIEARASGATDDSIKKLLNALLEQRSPSTGL